MNRLLFIIGLSFFHFQLSIAETILVPQDYPAIQTAIDSSSFEGDTIIVAPGIYVENIDYNGKDIYLTSHYFITEHDSSIHNTIIDGNQNGSVVTFYGGETRDAVLNGFTITNGSGRGYNNKFGGGLYIRESSPYLQNCIIKRNFGPSLIGGGGLLIRNSNAFLSNLLVTENEVSFDGGGILFNSSEIEMDTINRCSIYLNEAAEHNDIYCTVGSELITTIYLDTASVDSLDDYFIGGYFESVDILNGKLEKIAEDLYVSPEGDNNNSGLTPEEPLKNITFAMHIIDADSLNPRIIHLLPGVYSPSGGQHFPLNLRSYVSLIGAGKEHTIIDLEQVKTYAMMGANYENDITLSSMTIINGFANFDINLMAYTLKFYQNSGLIIDNMRFSHIISSKIINPTMLTSNMEWQDYTSTTIRNCEFIDNTVLTAVSLGWNTDILVQNCTFENNLPVESAEHHWYNNSHSSITVGGHDYNYEFPYSRRIENSLFSNNINNNPNADGMNTVALGIVPLHYPVDIVNCTFTDNISNFYGISIASDHLHHTKARFVNCIIWNNELPYEINVYDDYYEGQEMVYLNMAYNNVQNGTDDFLFEGAVDLVYEDTNMDTEPLFIDPETGDYTLQPNSPLIDAGTALYIIDDDTVLNLSPDQYYGDAPDMGAYEWYPVMDIKSDLPLFPETVRINSVYPNPFNSSMTVYYSIAHSGVLNLAIYDLTGRLIKNLIHAYVSTGTHRISLEQHEIASGAYLLKLTTPNGNDTKSITILK